MTKCAHDLCMRNAEEGSKYCDQCIQLSTRECNYCKLVVKTENRKLAEEVQSAINKRRNTMLYLVIVCITLVIITIICLLVGIL
jgi:hypothetical protein